MHMCNATISLGPRKGSQGPPQERRKEAEARKHEEAERRKQEPPDIGCGRHVVAGQPKGKLENGSLPNHVETPMFDLPRP